MNESEKLACAAEAARICADKGQSAEDNAQSAGIEFIRLEVQVATILFAITGFFAASLVNHGALDLYWVKVAFASGVLSLILSLLMGLLHLKRAEKFWDEVLHQRQLRFLKWTQAARQEVTFEHADAYHQGTALDKGVAIALPSWTWVMQSIFLGVGIAILFLLFVASLFVQGHPDTLIPAPTSTTTPAG